MTKQTDRELLELAAKAAGIQIDSWGKPNYYSQYDDEVAFTNLGEWNALTDDGDALRLAVDMHLQINRQERCVYVHMSPDSPLAFSAVYELEMYGLDPYAATRRAIVRAAALIGKEMK